MTRVQTKFPVTKNVLKVMLSTMDQMAFFSTQPYLQFLYKALFVTAYFGLFRICELTLTPSHHMVRAADVHIGKNKNKLMFVLHTPKMHNKGKKPQIIKIAAESFTRESSRLEICPFQMVREYLNIRGLELKTDEQFFVFSDGSLVTNSHFRSIMKSIRREAQLNDKLYGGHSFRSGRSIDLLNMGVSVETIKKLGCWKSNAVFTYLT